MSIGSLALCEVVADFAGSTQLPRERGHCVHFLPQTQWPHIDPHFFDVLKPFRLWANLARVLPARRIFAIRRRDRVLLFVVDNCLVTGRISLSQSLMFMAFPPNVVAGAKVGKPWPLVRVNYHSLRLCCICCRDFKNYARNWVGRVLAFPGRLC